MISIWKNSLLYRFFAVICGWFSAQVDEEQNHPRVYQYEGRGRGLSQQHLL